MKILNKEKISEAALALQAGEVVAFPTETVYGLGASIRSPMAIERIYKLKKRPKDNPLIAHIANLEQLDEIVDLQQVDPSLFAKFWPGSLTLILPKRAGAPGDLDTIAVRMPAHPIALSLIEKVGHPLFAPSANLSGKPSPTCVEHVQMDFHDQELLVLDGGICQKGVESTVLLLKPSPVILRPGATSQQEIEKNLGSPVSFSEKKDPRSPGTRYRHYAPKAPVFLLQNNVFQKKEGTFLIENPKQKNLFSLFREADRINASKIVVLVNEKVKKDPTLMDRLLKASENSASQQ